jgi:alanine racemase
MFQTEPGYFNDLMILFSALAGITNGNIIQLSEDVAITHLLTDSRKAIVANGSIFFAMDGQRHNGHLFIQKLFETGIRNFVVEKDIDLTPLRGANVLRVASSLRALQSIAALHRKQFMLPVIGVTGSNGKTIVKEWLYQLLSPTFSIVKNPGSYNSQLGVPLSVWNIKAHHTLGIFEAGISTVGEMDKLEHIIQPTIGLFTNIGTAHNEGFESIDQKIKEKLKLFSHSHLLIYCKNHAAIDRLVQQQNLRSLHWGYAADANIQVKKAIDGYTIIYQNKVFNLHLPFADAASVENCLHCVVVMLHLQRSVEHIQAGVSSLKGIPMRLELKGGINQCQVIDDTYNNDLAGLQISLDFLNNQHQKQKKRLILSDVEQSGVDDAVWVRAVVSLLEQSTVHSFIGIGEVLYKHRNAFAGNHLFYKTTEAFLADFNEEDYSRELILVKGARSFAFERIVHRFMRKVHGTIMEVDLGAMVHNLNYFRSRVNPSTKIMAMVKAFAYGSGSTEVANLLQYHGVDYLGVAYADEGVELRKNNIRLPIMVMNPSPETFELLSTHRLEPEIYSFSILQKLLLYLDGRPCTLHLKLDTGMHRLGFDEHDLPELITILKVNKNLTLASIFSHLAGADEAQHDAYSRQQAEFFAKQATTLSASLGYKPLFHLLNSPGILRLPQFQFDMVRLGIGLYGIDPTGAKNKLLKPVSTLKTVVSQVRSLQAGETVGYGRHGRVTEPTTIATIAIGYADGFSRAFSKGVGQVLVNGKRAAVVGNVCMDMTMVDVTGLTVAEGDEVIIYGPGLPIDEVAGKINTIPYEILTSTSERVKRVFVAESI